MAFYRFLRFLVVSGGNFLVGDSNDNLTDGSGNNLLAS